jgi:methionine-gamma-lyase
MRIEGIERAMGSVISPDNMYLVLRGIATYLEKLPLVLMVHCPGLSSDLGYKTTIRQMKYFGGRIT